MMKPEPVPSLPSTLIITTLGSTLAAMPATEAGGRSVSAPGTVPRLNPGETPSPDVLDTTYPPTSPPARADARASVSAKTASLRPPSAWRPGDCACAGRGRSSPGSDSGAGGSSPDGDEGASGTSPDGDGGTSGTSPDDDEGSSGTSPDDAGDSGGSAGATGRSGAAGSSGVPTAACPDPSDITRLSDPAQ